MTRKQILKWIIKNHDFILAEFESDPMSNNRDYHMGRLMSYANVLSMFLREDINFRTNMTEYLKERNIKL